MLKWFMSYAYNLKGTNALGIGHATLSVDGEHPIQKVQRWNETFDDRHTVLLSFQQFETDEPDADAEILIG